jgi:hypothetical protein
MSKKKKEQVEKEVIVKDIITNKQAFDLGEALVNPAIRNIKTSGFGITVIKNFNEIKKHYDAFHERFVPSDEFTAMLEKEEVKTNDDYEALKENEAYTAIITAREAQMDEYNKELEEEYPGVILKVKLNNTTLGISAAEIDSVILMLTL